MTQFSISAFSQADIKVMELTSGTCWMKSDWEKSWKVAHFQTGISHQLSKGEFLSDIQDKLEEELRAVGVFRFPSSEYKVVLQCNEDRLDIVMSVTNIKDRNLCVLGNIHKGQFQILNIFSNPYQEQGNCTRYYPLKLLVSSKSPELFLQVFDEYYQTEVEEVDQFGNFITITLKNHLRFQEHHLIKKVEQNPYLYALYEMIDLSSENYFPGDAVRIYQGEFKGF